MELVEVGGGGFVHAGFLAAQGRGWELFLRRMGSRSGERDSVSACGISRCGTLFSGNGKHRMRGATGWRRAWRKISLERKLEIGKFDIRDCKPATSVWGGVHPLDERIATGKSLGMRT